MFHPKFTWLWLAVAALAADNEQAPGAYILGPDDQIIIRAIDLEEIKAEPVRIDMRGNISLPLLGRMHVAGLALDQVEAELTSRLRAYLREPEVTVSIAEFRSQPVSVLGAVNNPGVLQLQGRRTMFEVLSQVGGLRADAGNSIKITRRREWGPIPLPGAAEDPSHEYSVADVSVKSIMDAKNPRENIQVKPNDVISVPKAELVYVIGAVRKPGGFVLSEKETLSVLQALSLAEGIDHASAPQNSKVLRESASQSRRSETAVDVKKILAGTSPDVPLRANDILFIPASASKNVALRGLEAAIQIGTGVAIYRR